MQKQTSKQHRFDQSPFRLRKMSRAQIKRGMQMSLANLVTEPSKRKSVSLSRLSKSSKCVIDGQATNWRRRRGKMKLQRLSEEDMISLKRIFKSLDRGGEGYLQPMQIYQPFTSLGLISSVEELNNLLRAFDQNKNGVIEFAQFVKIARLSAEGKTSGSIKRFFKSMLQDDCFGDFTLHYTKKRRDLLMQSLKAQRLEPQPRRRLHDSVSVLIALDKIKQPRPF